MKDILTLISKGDLGLALVDAKEAKIIISYDNPHKPNSEEYKQYEAENAPTAYIMCNLWLFDIDSHSKRSALQLKTLLLSKGLIYCIGKCSDLADGLIHQLDSKQLVDLEFYPVFSDLLSQLDATSVNNDLDMFRRVLEILRFPKRYSPSGQVDTLNNGLGKFVQLNQRIRSFNADVKPKVSALGGYDRSIVRNDYGIRRASWAQTYSPKMVQAFLAHNGSVTTDCNCENLYRENYLYEDIKREVAYIIKGTPLAQTSYDLDELAPYCYFSGGATSELEGRNNTIYKKLVCLARDLAPYYLHPLYPWSKKNPKLSALDSCVVKAVEKSYKTPRIIAKEPTWRNFVCSGIREKTIEVLKKKKDIWPFLTTLDQSGNREIAWESSIFEYTCLATADLTAASDSIPAWMGCDLFPVFAHNPELRSAYMRIGKDYYHNNIFLTSGHALTFLCEAIVFLAIARVATRYARVFQFSDPERDLASRKRRSRYYAPTSFGDDVTIDVRAFDTFVSLMESLGFTVNVEKSFTSPSPYRESCGEEYLYGYPMHGCKWPRTTYQWSKTPPSEAVASLVALQHNLFYRDWRISLFLSGIVQKLVPTMTSSAAGCDCDDLWATVPIYGTKSAPASKAIRKPEIINSSWRKPTDDGFVNQRFVIPAPSPEEIPTREIHCTLRTEYPVPASDKHLLTNDLVEMYLYVQFLMEGPMYEDEFLKQLGVSCQRSRAAIVTAPLPVWRPVTR